ncbi:2-oxoglutarate dehydrogenase E2 component (dihydrolipoamide succinyltransferase) [Arachidicoccus rhizosphaerae]|uniref:Dihydrolipoamide acetyltransferase component of pyruvate dehydrogenase complex n=1 Tax=Arachidicoccus rhizosphaerae TaxID=551991 RepID=A0A1H3YJ33_9BACT|nr:dihydrolipoamide acetyltransferase family protein [Arachidicoccus rhizosphaerae]SEA11201.1 2-oxoglutarate dehydrogenase E2 component (dihydrolipoamide succinyltransferase) [Arachidicoccus rhizosphaerae]
MALIELKMPALGEGIIEATVLKWLKQPGDQVQEEEMVLEIATDKVDSEVPSTVSGILKEVLFEENQVAPVGATIALIESDATADLTDTADSETAKREISEKIPQDSSKDTFKDEDNASETPAPGAELTVPYLPVVDSSSLPTTHNQQGNNGFYSPLVMSIAAKEGIDPMELARITGTGNEGRLTKKDLLNYLGARAAVPASTPATSAVSPPTASKPAGSSTSAMSSFSGETEVIEMDRMRKLIAKHMKDSQNTYATVTSFAEVDVTHMVQWREKVKKDFEAREKTKITFTPLFVDCVARTIKRFPLINSSVDGNQIIIKKSINIGMATALPSGNLIVPVIKNADHLNLVGLSKAVNDLAFRARNNQLKPADTQEGTFTLTNVGSFGSLGGTPIINQPQVAILAIGTIKKRPVVIETPMGDTIGIRHIMILSLSYDHRIIDGAMGSMFLDAVVKEIENWDLNKKY